MKHFLTVVDDFLNSDIQSGSVAVSVSAATKPGPPRTHSDTGGSTGDQFGLSVGLAPPIRQRIVHGLMGIGHFIVLSPGVFSRVKMVKNEAATWTYGRRGGEGKKR